MPVDSEILSIECVETGGKSIGIREFSDHLPLAVEHVDVAAVLVGRVEVRGTKPGVRNRQPREGGTRDGGHDRRLHAPVPCRDRTVHVRKDEAGLLTVERKIGRACGDPRRLRVHLARWPIGRAGRRPSQIRNSERNWNHARCAKCIDAVQGCDGRPVHAACLVGDPERTARRKGESPRVFQVRVEVLRRALESETRFVCWKRLLPALESTSRPSRASICGRVRRTSVRELRARGKRHPLSDARHSVAVHGNSFVGKKILAVLRR